MNRGDVIRMAREAGIDAWWDSGNECREDLQTHLERFASIVAEAEREACAMKMDVIAQQCMMEDSDHAPFEYAAVAIRARGNQ